MIKLRHASLIIAIALIVLAGCGGDSEQEPVDLDTETASTSQVSASTPEAELIAAMDEAISFVEKDDIKGLFERFTPPVDMNRLKDSSQLDGAIAQFNIFKGAFVEAMIESKTIQPEFNEDTTRASYHVIEAPVPGEYVVFGKIDGKWYFTD
jgi:ABC-type glycerol-3-phosphate transport system substrate-binding protein